MSFCFHTEFLALTVDGRIFVDVVTTGSGPHDLERMLSGFHGWPKGRSIHYSNTTSCLFVSWFAQPGCAMQIDADNTCVALHNLQIPEGNGEFRDLPFEIVSWVDVEDPQVEDTDFIWRAPSSTTGAVAALLQDKDSIRVAIVHVLQSSLPICFLGAQFERKIIGLVDSGSVSQLPSMSVLQDNGSVAQFLLSPLTAFSNHPLTVADEEDIQLPGFVTSWPMEPPNPWLHDHTIFSRAQEARVRIEGDIDETMLHDIASEAFSSSSDRCILRARSMLPTHYIAGLQIYVGARGSPSLFLAELGREVDLKLNCWNAIPFSYIESQVLATHTNLLTLVFASTPHQVILNALQVYVLPRFPLGTTKLEIL